MAHLQYLPGDPRLVDQIIYELKSKGIFDQFRKECISDVDTKPAYQNLRQRVENSVSAFLSRQGWQQDANKNQMREKLRKHVLDGKYLDQGIERIVDQVLNPKVSSVFVPQVEDLVYDYLGIARKKTSTAETSNGKGIDLLPNDLEAVSPGSVKSNDDKNEAMNGDDLQDTNMEIDEEKSEEDIMTDKDKLDDTQVSGISELTIHDSNTSIDKENIPFPPEDIIVGNIPHPVNSPKVDVEKIELPKEPSVNIPLPDEISTDIPLPDEISEKEKEQYFKPINSDDDESSSDSSIIRNMSPLTPIRNFNNENSSDAQQAFENDSTNNKAEDKKEPSSFRFTIETKSAENSPDAVQVVKKDTESKLSFRFNNQVNINNLNTPVYEDSSNSHNLQIDYESDANSKVNIEAKVPELDQTSEEVKKGKKVEERKSSHKSSHRSRDSHRHSSSKDRKFDSKQSSSKDSSRHDRTKSTKDETKSKSSDKEKSKDKSEKKDSKDSRDSRDSSKHKSSHKSSSHKDSKSHRSSSSSHRHSSKHDDKKSSSSSQRDKDKSSKDKLKDSSSKSSSHRSDKSRKSSSSSGSKSKHEDKEKEKKSKKETDDHYSLSGRGNPNRRSTDRDSNDGSSSSKGSHNPASSKSSESKKDSKSSSKMDSTSTSGESTSPSDKENISYEMGTKTKDLLNARPIVRIEKSLETPLKPPSRLPFVPDVTLKKPKFAANLKEAKQMIKMRKFLEEEQRRMNQEAALLLEFQANVRPSLSQVYSSVPGPELEFACITNASQHQDFVATQHYDSGNNQNNDTIQLNVTTKHNELIESVPSTITAQPANDTVQSEGINQKDVSIKNETTSHSDAPIQPNDRIKLNDQVIQERLGVFGQNVTEIDCTIDKDLEVLPESIPKKRIFDESSQTVEDNEVKNTIADIKNITNNVNSEQIALTIKMRQKIERTYKESDGIKEEESKTRTKFFEVTIVTEELSESEDHLNIDECINIIDADIKNDSAVENEQTENYKLNYFGEHEKYNAELERAKFSNFLKVTIEKELTGNKIYLINCDPYEEDLFRDVSKEFGDFEIINYHRNGHLKAPKPKNIVKNINLSTEVTLPIDTNYDCNDLESPSQLIFSPHKSECSFDLSSDYDAKIEEMVTKASRREIMEIILGNMVDESQGDIPTYDYFKESSIDNGLECDLKRKFSDVESVNNNLHVLSPNKIRKLSVDHISSTTEESEERVNHKVLNNTRSKYLGRPGRVGLPRPKKSNVSNSPSSDMSVENYEQNGDIATPNGRVKPQRNKVQRYDTSDLYKPKLHYLSRRNNIT